MPMCQNRSVLVLGASGKLGRILRRQWQITPPKHLTVAWQYRENPPSHGWQWRPGEVPQWEATPVDTVLALWGVTSGSEHKLAKNRPLAHAALTLAETLGATRVLHCSSAAVYPPGPDPLRETQAGGEINAYGAAKLDMERAIADWSRAHPQGPKSCIMRIGNMVGADSLFAAIARGDNPIRLDQFASGAGPWRSYISAPTLARVVEALITCSDNALPGLVNVASTESVAMEALARAAGCDVAWRQTPDTAAPMVALDTSVLSALVDLPVETPEELIASWRRLEAPS